MYSVLSKKHITVDEAFGWKNPTKLLKLNNMKVERTSNGWTTYEVDTPKIVLGNISIDLTDQNHLGTNKDSVYEIYDIEKVEKFNDDTIKSLYKNTRFNAIPLRYAVHIKGYTVLWQNYNEHIQRLNFLDGVKHANYEFGYIADNKFAGYDMWEKITLPLKKPKGLYQKYIISKVDGSAVDKEAEYFVLRLDNKHDVLTHEDVEHRRACRVAIQAYAEVIEKTIPELAADLKAKYQPI